MTIGAFGAYIFTVPILLVMALLTIDLFESFLCDMFIADYGFMAIHAADLSGVYGCPVTAHIYLKLAFLTSKSMTSHTFFF